jgi:hypothetical protein
MHGTCDSASLTMKAARLSTVFFSLFFEVNKVQAPILQTLHWHDLQAGHHGGLHGVSAGPRTGSMHTHRGVRSMRANRNQANITMAFTA